MKVTAAKWERLVLDMLSLRHKPERKSPSCSDRAYSPSALSGAETPTRGDFNDCDPRATGSCDATQQSRKLGSKLRFARPSRSRTGAQKTCAQIGTDGRWDPASGQTYVRFMLSGPSILVGPTVHRIVRTIDPAGSLGSAGHSQTTEVRLTVD